ncbi:YbaN family protein [uncultured Ferrimonas sp.]|uniref:YbaN family protein n=1 Tax=uncultured Ferrimonas sp. TaxID=432640 RepID=UPI0026203C6D|nr:YbaN family protein [uncultured Ferrimonas sp.]
MQPIQGPMRYLLLALGWLAVVCGTIGLFLPLIPTVPFLLLATFCFSRTSERCQQWLFNNRLLGPVLRNYLERRGLTKRQLLTTLVSLWLSISIGIYLVPLLPVKLLLVAIACGVSIHLCRMKRLEPEPAVKS